MSKIIIGGYDCETTGLLSPDHRIIEACVQHWSFDTKTGEHDLLDTKTWRIKPGRSITPKAFETHGISADELSDCPPLEEVAEEIAAELNKCAICVAHNGNGFDWPFLIQEFERIGVEVPDFEPVDTMIDGRAATPLGKAPNLKELCFALDVEYLDEEAHAAEYDVKVMMQAFFNGLRHGVFTLPHTG